MSRRPELQPLPFAAGVIAACYAIPSHAASSFQGQIVHLILLIGLVTAAIWLVDFSRLRERSLFGIGGHIWFVISIAVPVIHQVYVWLAWRSQLCFGAVTKWFGSRGFLAYEVIFLILLAARPISLIFLTMADHDSLALTFAARVLICVLLAIPAVYTFYSVARYFGIARAAGIDHFDERYRSEPLVRNGIFRYISNSMYSCGFLILWVIAIVGASWAAIVAAGFSHAYIWVHYFCTERPDMKRIYGS